MLDNLNTQNSQSLIETFGERTAKQLLKRIVWRYTPKHSSWLNMAEIKLPVLTRQCFDRGLPALAAVARHAGAWSRDRNRQKVTIQWTLKRERR